MNKSGLDDTAAVYILSYFTFIQILFIYLVERQIETSIIDEILNSIKWQFSTHKCSKENLDDNKTITIEEKCTTELTQACNTIFQIDQKVDYLIGINKLEFPIIRPLPEFNLAVEKYGISIDSSEEYKLLSNANRTRKPLQFTRLNKGRFSKSIVIQFFVDHFDLIDFEKKSWKFEKKDIQNFINSYSEFYTYDNDYRELNDSARQITNDDLNKYKERRV